MAAFQEVFRLSGVDERRNPPGMVVPFGRDNIVALVDPGRKLKFEPNGFLEIKEIDGAQIRTRVMQVRDTFSEPDIDPQLKAASLPAIFNGDARFFEIKSRIKTGLPGHVVTARSANKMIQVPLQVAVLPEIKVKVAIRNVMVAGSGGVPTFHAKKPCSEQDELLMMNRVWRPQANIAFELVPSDWLVIDNSLAAVKQEIANAVGMKDASLATFPGVVGAEKLKDFFVKHKIPGAHLTIFCVDKIWSSGSSPNGKYIPPLGIAFIASYAVLTPPPMKPGIFSAATRRARPNLGIATATRWSATGRKT